MSNKAYFEWLLNEISLQNSYHNHKETMAWLLTSIYVPSILTLGFSLSLHNINDCWRILIFVLAAVLAETFVIRQLWLRSIAADTHRALTKLLNDFCKNADSFSSLNIGFEDNKQFPNFIQDQIENNKCKGRNWIDRLCTDTMLCLAILLSSLFAYFIAARLL